MANKELEQVESPSSSSLVKGLLANPGKTHSKTAGSRFFYGYVIVVAATLTLTLTNGAMYSFGVFLKPLSDEFGWTRAMTSGAYSLFLFVLALLYTQTGRLTDRLGPRLVGTVCGVILGAGYFLMSQVSALWQFYLLYSVVAIGMSGGLVPLTSTVARWFTKRRGLMSGIVVSGAGLGTVILPPVATWLISVEGWRTSYRIVGIVTLIFVVAASQFLRRDPGKMGLSAYGDTGSDGREKRTLLVSQTAGFSFREARRARQLWVLLVMYFCFGMNLQSMMVHTVPHATDIGIPAMTAANILAVVGGVSIVGRVGIGVATDRIGSKACLIIGFVLLAAAMLWLQGVRELWTFYLFGVVFGLAMGGMVALEPPVVADLFGLKAHGAILGVVASTSIIGGAVGSFLSGRIYDITGSYTTAFLGLAALSITGLALSLLLKRLPSLR